MENESHAEFARELGRELTAQVAPEELDFYDDLVDAELRPPTSREDHPMGFGIPDGVGAAISLLMFAAAQGLVKILWEAAEPALKDLTKQGAAEVGKLLSAKFKDWIGSKLTTPAPIKLSPDARTEFIKKWVQDGARLGVSEVELTKFKSALERATE